MRNKILILLPSAALIAPLGLLFGVALPVVFSVFAVAGMLSIVVTDYSRYDELALKPAPVAKTSERLPLAA